MATILEKIVHQTKRDLNKRQQCITLRDLETLPDFERPRRSLQSALSQQQTVSIIAEIKKASPSKGLIREDFNPRKLAAQYKSGGAAAISVLTDTTAFQGDLAYLRMVSNEVDLPALRKDFIVEPYQIKEARAYGADAILLIATITSGNQLSELLQAAQEFELACLVECYTQDDLNRVNLQQIDILGANNRDLHTFEVNLHRGIDLLQQASEKVLTVSESGLACADDLKLLYDEGIDAALIGEFFMRQDDPGQAVRQMLDELHVLIGGKENMSTEN